ncbi:signal peptidase I [secondary endosymbiont of Ctenarytaina eucalypti]|uniref:Signal peptidase I n=1 Tax=secondary endosymbiont of Ctenarytaina eucalypti TaxID=1199245 RepID=J3Z4C7_9ENTR|nr:signal peptidase I [secondary endosymbiont of Ctenarytaina eucalypti]AFP85144.1 signal peptidase I [secondary endosymbiont of Ctenarytaina eucalypti]
MAKMFTLILTLTTLITGVLWCVERFNLASARRRQVRIWGKKHTTKAAEVKAGHEVAIHLSANPGWLKTSASIFPVLLFVFIVRSFFFEPFQIPSGSMMPTLLVGDFVLVKKFSYGIKDPITQMMLIETGHPQRGDVVVFKYPLNSRLNYIKRVVGLPGDRINYDPTHKRVTVCPGSAPALPITYSECTLRDVVSQPSNATSIPEASSNFLKATPNNLPDDVIFLAKRKESFGGTSHNVLTVLGQKDPVGMYYQQPGSALGEWIVPKGEYFMMGDNRDNSSDSRYWGFVPERNLLGKATIIWMSFDKQEGQWPTGIRCSRIGRIY